MNGIDVYFQADVYSEYTYALYQLSTGLYYDFSNNTFVATPTMPMLVSVLPPNVITPGMYHVNIPITAATLTTFPDGKYLFIPMVAQFDTPISPTKILTAKVSQLIAVTLKGGSTQSIESSITGAMVTVLQASTNAAQIALNGIII